MTKMRTAMTATKRKTLVSDDDQGQRQGSGAGCWRGFAVALRPLRQGRAHDLAIAGVHRDQPLAGPSEIIGVGIVTGLAGRVAELGGAQFVRAGHKGESLASERGREGAGRHAQPLGAGSGARGIGARRSSAPPPASWAGKGDRALLAHTRKGVTAVYARWESRLRRERATVVERSLPKLDDEPTAAIAA